MDGSSHGLIYWMSWHLPGGTGENHGKPENSWPLGSYLKPESPEYGAFDHDVHNWPCSMCCIITSQKTVKTT